MAARSELDGGGPGRGDGPGYPRELERDITTDLGVTVHVRPIRPDDGDRLVRFHQRLSPKSVYFRFFSPHPRLSRSEVERFTTVDYADRLALVAEVGGELVGVGRYDRTCGAEAEIAFVVADAWQHHGIATVLLQLLAEAARTRGVEWFVASTLPDNHDMIHLLTHSGFDVTLRLDGGVVTARFPIGRPRQRGGTGPR